jgi:integrase
MRRSGLRLGEMVALEWADIDFIKRQLCVQRSVWKGQIGSPTGGRLRYVPAHRSACRGTSGSSSSAWTVGPMSRRRRTSDPGFCSGVFSPGSAENKPLQQRLHMLRHTFCSHLAMRGAPARAIQERAGHRDLSTTRRYMQLSPAALDSAIRLLDCSGVLSPFWRHCADAGGWFRPPNGS